MIEAKELCKSYGNTTALDKVSFSVDQGEIFGFIGPDGAGKSTLFEIITSLMEQDSGECFINGLSVTKDYSKIRSVIGYMPGRFSLYPDLSVKENLQFFARIFGCKVTDNYHLIESIYKLLEPFAKRKAGALSGGMKQKLALCCALIHKPIALFLDEPTTGVDPVSRKEFWDNLVQLKQQDIPVVVSTPYMDEAIRCDRIAMIYNGRIMKIGTPETITREFSGLIATVICREKKQLKQLLASMLEVESFFSFGEQVHIVIRRNTGNELNTITQRLEQELSECRVFVIEPGIEDCFLQLMGSSNA